MWEGGAHKAPHLAVNVAGGGGHCLSSVAHGRLLQQMLPISIPVRTALIGFSELFWGEKGVVGKKMCGRRCPGKARGREKGGGYYINALYSHMTITKNNIE